MDRRRALGVALVLISAFAFGSGALFAKPAYAAGRHVRGKVVITI